ncbi:MAG: TerC family protein [Bryobacteraceae bacterium]|nr:TerC family protein [Bryobacteraceae bacterium]
MADIVFWHWAVFGALVAVLLTLDLFVFHRNAHAPSLKESAGWTLFWCGLAVAFNGLVWWWRGSEQGLQFLAAYLVEKSLSVDNIFVFAVIFRAFCIPLKYQYRILFWGILGAIIMRLAFIVLGASLIQRFDWVLSVFGAFLVYTAVRLAFSSEAEVDPHANPMLRIARRLLPVSREDHGNSFFARENARWCITPLFLVLLVIESTDVMFAVDSVPAIFGITRDPFILFTSNIFAILGLRALYFLLAGVIDLFRYLHYGLSAVLAFVGLKMIAEYWIAPHGEHLVPPAASLGIILALLSASIAASLIARHREQAVHARDMSPADAIPDKTAIVAAQPEPVAVMAEDVEEVSMFHGAQT